MVLAKVATAVLLLFFIFTAPSTAEIKTTKIRSDNRPIILFQKFGFTQTGNITISVSAVSVTSSLSQPDAAPLGFQYSTHNNLGFFLLSEESLRLVLLELQQNPYFCVLDSKFIVFFSTFEIITPPPHSSSFQKSFGVTYPNEYSLFFANCNPESLVTMDVRTELYNVDEGSTKDYLSVGLTQLPFLYLIFSVVYLCFLGVWIFVCLRNQRSVHQAHLFMSGLLVVKVLGLLCAAENNHHVKITGTPHGWNVLMYIFQFITSLISFTLIVLMGAGWPNLKPVLQAPEKKVLMILIPLQVLANLASIVIGETGPSLKDWVTWNQVFLLIDIICCCTVIFSVIWSIKSLSKTDGKAARNLTKDRLMRIFFCIMVIGYFLFTRIGVFAMKTIVDYKKEWVGIAAEEITSIVFYLVVFYIFRPIEEDEYVVVDGKGEYQEAPEMAK